jgi:hypothetical protein
MQPLSAAARPKAPARLSRFAAAAENDEAQAAAAAQAPLSSPVQPGRSSSFTSLRSKDGSSGSLRLGDRSASFTAFGGSSGGNSLSMSLRASSFTALRSSSSLSNRGSPSPTGKQQAQQHTGDASTAAAWAAAAAQAELHQMQL